MKVTIKQFAVPILVAVLSACSSERAATDSHTSGYYLKSALWDKTNLKVCWKNMNHSSQSDRDRVRNRITDTWQANSSLRFLDWNACADNPNADIRLEVADQNPAAYGLGRYNQYTLLNFSFKTWSPSCSRSEESRVACLETNAIHEFGHALGIVHEHHRSDRAEDCVNEPQGTSGDVAVGSFDRDSIMNYCYNSSYRNKLSPQDIRTIQEMYGPPAQPMIETLQWVKVGQEIYSLKAGDALPIISFKAEGGAGSISYKVDRLQDECAWDRPRKDGDQFQISGTAPTEGVYTLDSQKILVPGNNTCRIRVRAFTDSESITFEFAITIHVPSVEKDLEWDDVPDQSTYAYYRDREITPLFFTARSPRPITYSLGHPEKECSWDRVEVLANGIRFSGKTPAAGVYTMNGDVLGAYGSYSCRIRAIADDGVQRIEKDINFIIRSTQAPQP